MSKSLRRVTRALEDAGVAARPVEIGPANTAQMAADLAGCGIDQIAKSVMVRGLSSGAAILFVTAGGNRVDDAKAARLAGEALGKADAGLIRAQTGFAIGGVAPVGHVTRPRAYFDARLLDFDEVWAAAGTPRHVFAIAPRDLLRASGAQLADFTIHSEKM
ncbi:YbaK/EbsC family protein [Roseovarius salinarum]|uniref:YbaK/EbsC family protein n=1 Tax=Roseovarius salinarum TaxID=1981892 RepID=UPI000C349880|nr:YbaK/EbsC family protein [Roseovarius salinarum]